MKTQQGFTLIELVMVIVILGILAATALPKFASLQGDARIASINAAAGAIKSAMNIVHAKHLVEGDGDAGSVTLDGNTIITTVFGYPNAASIASAAGLSSDDYTVVNGDISLKTDCKVVYVQAADANTLPTVTVTTSGCS